MVTLERLQALQDAAQDASNAALGDSNDTEISLLRDALEMALDILGLRFPDPEEDDE